MSLRLLGLMIVLVAFQNCGAFSTMTEDKNSNDGTGASPAVVIEGSDSQIRLSDQHYVSNVLANVYQLNPVSDNVLYNLILNQPVLFGGPCDTYLGDCSDLANTQLAVVPGMNSARAALTTRSCDLINSVDLNITNAVQNLGATPALSTATGPSDAGLQLAYQASPRARGRNRSD